MVNWRRALWLCLTAGILCFGLWGNGTAQHVVKVVMVGSDSDANGGAFAEVISAADSLLRQDRDGFYRSDQDVGFIVVVDSVGGTAYGYYLMANRRDTLSVYFGGGPAGGIASAVDPANMDSAEVAVQHDGGVLTGQVVSGQISGLTLFQPDDGSGLNGAGLVGRMLTAVQPISGISSDPLKLVGDGDTVWVATSDGLNRYVGGTVEAVMTGAPVMSLAVGKTVTPSSAGGIQPVLPDFGATDQRVLEGVAPGSDILLNLRAQNGAKGAVGFRMRVVFDGDRVDFAEMAQDSTAAIQRLDPVAAQVSADTLEITAFQEPGGSAAGSGWWPNRAGAAPALASAATDSGLLARLRLLARDAFTGQVRFRIAHVEYFRRVAPSDSVLGLIPSQDAAIVAVQDDSAAVADLLGAEGWPVRLDGDWLTAGDQGVRLVRDVRDSAVVEVYSDSLGTGTVGFEAVFRFDKDALDLTGVGTVGAAVNGLTLIGPRPKGFVVTEDSVRLTAISTGLTAATAGNGRLARLRFRPLGNVQEDDAHLGETAVQLSRIGYFTVLPDTTLAPVTANVFLDRDIVTAGAQVTRDRMLPEKRDSAAVLADSFPGTVRNVVLTFAVEDTSRLRLLRFNLNTGAINGFASVQTAAADTVRVSIQAFQDVQPPQGQVRLGWAVFESRSKFRDRVRVALSRVEFRNAAGQTVGTPQTTEVPLVFSGVSLRELAGSSSGMVLAREPVISGQGVFSDTLAINADSSVAVAAGSPSVWVGTRQVGQGAGGLLRLNRETGAEAARYTKDNSDLLDSDISALAERDGTVWVGTLGEGLYRFDPDAADSLQWKRFRFPGATDTTNAQDDVITALTLDDAGGVWAGTAGGGVGYLYDHTGDGAWRLVREEAAADSAKLTFNFVSCLAVSDTTVWVGTSFGGLFRIAFTLSDTTIDRVDAVTGGSGGILPVPKNINDIVVQADSLWVATSEGLLKLTLDATTGAVTDATLFDADALRGVGKAISSVAVDDDRIWLTRRPTHFFETVWDVSGDTDATAALAARNGLISGLALNLNFVTPTTGQVVRSVAPGDSIWIDDVPPVIASIHPRNDSTETAATRNLLDVPLEISAHVMDPGFVGVRSIDRDSISVTIDTGSPEPASNIELEDGIAQVARHVTWAHLDSLGGGAGIPVGLLADSTVTFGDAVDVDGNAIPPIGLDSVTVENNFVIRRVFGDTLAVIDRGINLAMAPDGKRLVRTSADTVYHNLRVLPALHSLGAGTHTVTIRVLDQAGNVAVRTATFDLVAGEPPGNPELRLVSYPNPFDSVRRATIRFYLDEPADPVETYEAALLFCDVAGVPVHKINMSGLSAGEHRVSWDGRTGNGDMLPNGVYFCRLTATASGGGVLTPVYWKMVIFNH